MKANTYKFDEKDNLKSERLLFKLLKEMFSYHYVIKRHCRVSEIDRRFADFLLVPKDDG